MKEAKLRQKTTDTYVGVLYNIVCPSIRKENDEKLHNAKLQMQVEEGRMNDLRVTTTKYT